MRPSNIVLAVALVGGVAACADESTPAPIPGPTPATMTSPSASAAVPVAPAPAVSPSPAGIAGSAAMPTPAAPVTPTPPPAGSGPAMTGAGGVPAVAPGGAAAMAGTGAAPAREDQGKGDGQDVVTIGDSYMRLNNEGVEPSLDRLTMVTYRHHAVMGTQLSNGQIPGQYDDAKADNPDIKTIVMTGGGNDFLQNGAASSDCADVGPNCSAVLDRMRETMVELWTEMNTDGVEDVFFLTYPPTPMTTLGPAFESVYAKLSEDCAMMTPMRCHFVNATPAFEGKTRELIRGDNIHPTGEGYDILAKLIWDEMIASGARR
jgi:lysophospholipase L1-like esterase